MVSPRTSRLPIAALAALASPLVVGAILLHADFAAAQCPPGRVFGAHAPYPVGASPKALLLADLNEDGVLDLVTASGAPAGSGTGAGMVMVRLGQGSGGAGDGSFGAPAYFAAGVQLSCLVAADFDEDGILDVAAGDDLGQKVVVLLGKGDAGVGNGTFAAPTAFAAGRRPRSIAAGDFDEDGITDLVFGDEAPPNGDQVTVLRGLGAGGVGDGGFAPPVSFPAGETMLGLVVADFDEDGISDLAVTTWSPMGVSVLRGAGTAGAGNGAFLPPVLYPTSLPPFGLVAGDFDEDGITDLAATSHDYEVPDGGSVRILRGRGEGGTGDGTFDPEVIHPASRDPSAIVADDFDGDGIVDLAVANTIVDSVTVLLGQGIDDDGDGTFGETTSYRAPATPFALASADLNADGRPDLVVAEFSSSEARVFLGGCAPHTGLGPRIVAVKDAPADQGGRVFVAWERSPYDGPAGTLVRDYTVSRRESPEGPWETLATLPAQRLEGYGYLAATTRDSTPDENPLTQFRVGATTAEPDVWFESRVDSGYSVDNLAPPPPEAFVAQYGAGVALSWAAGSAPDHARFRVHRGDRDDFEAAPGNLVAELAATAYVDAVGTSASRYRLVAVDRHGNASASVPATRSEAPPAPALALAITRVAPNPARDGRVTIAFTLPDDAPATLELFDPRGRVVCARALAGAGEGSIVLPGERSRLAAGVYVVRLTQGGRSVRTKSVVFR
jgi:hypothetical protein